MFFFAFIRDTEDRPEVLLATPANGHGIKIQTFLYFFCKNAVNVTLKVLTFRKLDVST